MTGKEKPTEVGRTKLITVMNYKTNGTEQQGPSAAGRAALDAQKERTAQIKQAAQERAYNLKTADTPENLARTFALEFLSSYSEVEFKSNKNPIIGAVEQYVKDDFRSRGRESEVEKFKFSLTELNAVWKELRCADQGKQEQDAVDPTRYDVEPADEEVDPAKLHNDLAKLFEKVVYFPDSGHQASACALFVMATYCIDAFQLVPYITITAPEKGCGKSTLFDLFEVLVRRPLASMDASASALYRLITEFEHPTILLDEVDTFLKDKEGVIGVLNSGIKRNGCVWRTEGDKNKKTVRFKTFGFKVLCGIGARNISDTVADRSVIIELAKKPASHNVRMLSEFPQETFTDLRRQCTRLAIDAAEWMKNYRIPSDDFPKELSDRGRQKYTALFTVADYIDHINSPAGESRRFGQWARKSAVQLSKVGAKQSLSNQLLENIRELLYENYEFKNAIEIKSESLCRALLNDPTWGWEEGNKGRPINVKWMTFRLNEYGIKTHRLRVGRGFKKHELLDGMANYLPEYQEPKIEN